MIYLSIIKKQYINIHKKEAKVQRLRSLSLRSLTSLLPFCLEFSGAPTTSAKRVDSPHKS